MTADEFNDAMDFLDETFPLDDAAHAARVIELEASLRGGIIGTAEIVDCVRQSPSPWFFGPYGFVLRNATPMPFQPCRGQLGFFNPDFDMPPPKAKASKPPPAEAAPLLDLFS